MFCWGFWKVEITTWRPLEDFGAMGSGSDDGIAKATLQLTEFVRGGRRRWRTRGLDIDWFARLEAVRHELADLGLEGAPTPNDLRDAIEQAVKAAIESLPDPYSAAGLALFGYADKGPRPAGKAAREEAAGQCLDFSGRWLRTPNPAAPYDGRKPIDWLIEQVAQGLLRPGEAPPPTAQPTSPGGPPSRIHAPRRNEEHRENFVYDIRLSDLGAPVKIGLTEPASELHPRAFHRLETEIQYTVRVDNPHELYYVAAVFSRQNLPDWYSRSNFLLREVVELPPDLRDALGDRFRPTPADLPTTLASVPQTGSKVRPLVDEPPLRESDLLQEAAVLLSAEVQIGQEQLQPQLFYLDEDGLCWGYKLTGLARASMREGTADVAVRLSTFMNRYRTDFPVGIVAPTRHPVIRFDYARAAIENVTVDVGFGLDDPRCVRVRGDGNRISVITDEDVEVPGRTGCTFSWPWPASDG
jgi:hypothetical protein